MSSAPAKKICGECQMCVPRSTDPSTRSPIESRIKSVLGSVLPTSNAIKIQPETTHTTARLWGINCWVYIGKFPGASQWCLLFQALKLGCFPNALHCNLVPRFSHSALRSFCQRSPRQPMKKPRWLWGREWGIRLKAGRRHKVRANRLEYSTKASSKQLVF